MTDLLILGGGAAGFGALRGYREAGGSGPVTLVTDEPTLPYERPPLSKEFLRGDLPAGDLPLENPEFCAGVDVVHARVEHVDPDDRTVRLADGTGRWPTRSGCGPRPRRPSRPSSSAPASSGARSPHPCRYAESTSP